MSNQSPVSVPPADSAYIAQLWDYPQLTIAIFGMRRFSEDDGGLQLQYWRSHEDLARFARQLPHTEWWKWLINNRGKGFSFYHEIYQCKAAEAIFEVGTQAVGPGTFCVTSPIASGEGRSEERQRRLLEAVPESSPE